MEECEWSTFHATTETDPNTVVDTLTMSPAILDVLQTVAKAHSKK